MPPVIMAFSPDVALWRVASRSMRVFAVWAVAEHWSDQPVGDPVTGGEFEDRTFARVFYFETRWFGRTELRSFIGTGIAAQEVQGLTAEGQPSDRQPWRALLPVTNRRNPSFGKPLPALSQTLSLGADTTCYTRRACDPDVLVCGEQIRIPCSIADSQQRALVAIGRMQRKLHARTY